MMELDHYVYLNDHEDRQQEYESGLMAQQLAIYPGSPDLSSGTHLIILYRLKLSYCQGEYVL